MTYTAAQAAGDLNVVVVGEKANTATVSSITDKMGNTYTLAVGPTVVNGFGWQSIYYAKNIAAAAAGANVVTVGFSKSAQSFDIRILEYAGADRVDPLDVTAAGTGSFGPTSSSGSATTTNASDLLFGANLVQDTTSGSGSGYTRRILTSDSDIAEDEMVTSKGSYSATASVSFFGDWIMQMVAFRTPVPTVTSVSPNTGSTAGGTAVTITGTNFASGATVTFGSTAATNVVVSSSTTITATTPAGTAGAATVTVTASGAAGSLASGFTYLAPPIVSSVSPNTGATVGGTAVTITGANFASGATVTFGTAAATNVVVSSSTSITATTPAGTVGSVTVTVTVNSHSGSLANSFTYFAAPTVTGVSPNTGPTSGGTAVTITGTNFASGASVTFGTASATNVVVSNSTTITATTPTGTAGTATVTVMVSGHSGTLASGFTYLAPPTVTGVSPNSGSTAGGTAVTITGTNFASGATVTFGTAAATNVVVASSTSITATTPAGTTGAVTVTVTVSGHSGSLTSGFTYFLVPTVTGVSPNTGSTAGGTAVTITGTNFASGATVTFGSTAATSVVVSNSTTITAITPAGTAGAVTVAVTVSSHSGSLASGFTYFANPTVTGVSPNTGSTLGGTAVTITGTNFASGATVTFGSTAATNVVVASSTSITATTPAGAVGAVTVTVTVNGHSGSLATGFTYVATPTVTGVSPNTGTTAGGTAITITGTNFVSGATVIFGTASATSVVVSSSTTMTAVAPAGTAGAVTITVTVSGQSGSLASGFTYFATPTVTGVSPNSGATGGGTPVTITGTNFASGATVTFGTAAATSIVVSSSTTITAVTPAGTAGAVTVTVTVGGHSGSLASGFTYAAIPGVTSVSPNTGVTAGGTAVTITGTNFVSGATVTFGSTAATNVVVSSSTTITATTPAGTAGTVTVTVTVSGHSGSLASGFTYFAVPSVTGVSPNTGSTDGGTAVTITGTNFASGATVTFGTASATSVVVSSSTTVTAITPPESVGAVTVTVTSGGHSGSLANGFTYAAPATTITYVQGNYATPQTAQTSVPVTFTSAQTAGDLNVLVVGWNDTTATVSSVTDKSGNIYTLAVGPTVESGVATQSIYYAKKIAAAAAGVNIVTVTFSTAATTPDIRVLEYKGADPNSPVDVTAASTGTSTTTSSGAATTTNPVDLLFAADLVQTTTTGPGAGFTSRLLTSPDGDLAEDELVTTTGSYTATAPVIPSGAWIMQMVAFRAADTTPPTAPANLTASPASSNQINLSWTASTDNFGVTGYLVERCQGSGCSSFAQIGTSTTTTYSDIGVTASLSYSYRVRATDAAGNLSSYSNIVTTSTSAPSPTAPTVSVTGGGAVPNIIAEQEYLNFNYLTTHTTFPFNAAGGDVIVMTATTHGATTVLTPSDTFGNVWIPLAGPTNASAGNLTMEMWYVRNPITGPYNDAVTMNLSVAQPLEMSIVVIQGSNVSSPIDTVSLIGSDNGTQSTTIVSPSITTNFVNDVLLGWGKVSPLGALTNTFVPGGAYTELTGASDAFIEAETAVAATPGSYATSFTYAPAQDWQSAIVAVANNPNQTTLSWTASTEAGGNTIAGYLLQRCAGAGCTNFAQIGTTTAPTTTYNDAGLTPSTSYTYRVAAQDSVGTVGAYSTPVTIVIPATTPSLPGNLTAAVDQINSSHIDLSWSASLETGGTVSKYTVQRCTGAACTTGFTTIATTTGTTYTDPAPGVGAFTYRVQAVDAAGNLSPFSNLAIGATPPPTPASLTAVPSTVRSQIGLSWTVSTDNVTVSYSVERCQGTGCTNFAQIATVTTGTTYTDTPLTTNTTYRYEVQAVDVYGNLSPFSNIATATTPNLPVPSAPTSVSAIDGGAAPIVLDEQSYINSNSETVHTTYPFSAAGGDLIVLVASSHAGVTFTPSDTFGNTWISIAGPTNTTTGFDLRTQIWYAWNPITGPNNDTITMNLSVAEPLVMSVIVMQGSNISSPIDAVSLIGSDNGTQSVNVATPFVTTSAINDRLLGFVKVSGSPGGATFTSPANFIALPGASSDFLDAEAGTAATPGSYDATLTISAAQTWQAAVVSVANNPNQTTVSWTAATETGGGSMSAYFVQRCVGAGCTNFAPLGTTAAPATSFNDTGLTPSTSYTYEVEAVDVAGTLGPYSAPITIVTPGPAPSLPGNLTAIQDPSISAQIDLAWTASQEINGTVASYKVQRCMGAGCNTGFTTIGSSTTTSYKDPSPGQGAFTYRIQAVDATGNTGPFSNLAVAAIPDTIPPSTPTNLSASAAGSTQINLTWTASTDNVGVTGYLVQRCSGSNCTNFVQIGTSIGATYADMGLTPSSSYTYRVQATDAAGNLSGFSNTSATSTPAPPVPTAPGSPSVVDGGPGPTVSAVQGYINGNPLSSHTTAAFDSAGANLLVLCVDSIAGVTLTPSDSFNNTWISIAGPTSTTSGADLRTQLWYAWNPAVGPGHTVTVTLSTGEPLVMSVFAVQNADVSSPIDAVSLISSDYGVPTATALSPNIVTSAANDLLLGFAKVGNGAVFTAGSGFTLQAAASSSFLAAETGPAVTPGTYAASFTLSSGQDWQALIAAAASNPNQTTLSWSPSTGGSGTIAEYLVSRCQGVGCTVFSEIGTATGTTYNDTGLTSATSYTYKIQAQDTSSTLSPFSTTVTLVTPTPLPSLPGNLNATAASSTQNNLSWTASQELGGTISHYIIERCQGAGCTNFAQINTSLVTTTTYSDLTSSANTEYSYRVQAVDALANPSPFSNLAVVVTPAQ